MDSNKSRLFFRERRLGTFFLYPRDVNGSDIPQASPAGRPAQKGDSPPRQRQDKKRLWAKLPTDAIRHRFVSALRYAASTPTPRSLSARNHYRPLRSAKTCGTREPACAVRDHRVRLPKAHQKISPAVVGACTHNNAAVSTCQGPREFTRGFQGGYFSSP